MAKYLDENGLLYFWQKIKNLFAQKTELPGVVSKTAAGLAPQLPNETTTTKYLRQDGTWVAPPNSNTTYTFAEGSTDGAFQVTPSGGSAQSVPVHGLGAMAYKGSLAASDIPNLAASKITSGTFAAARIPSLDASKITSGTLDAARIPDLSGTYALKTEIAGMYKYKGSVATASALPASGQEVGDVYNIEAASVYGGAGMNVAWNGSAWDPLGEIFSITSITNAEIDTVVAS